MFLFRNISRWWKSFGGSARANGNSKAFDAPEAVIELRSVQAQISLQQLIANVDFAAE
jgi:hypothetical protein